MSCIDINVIKELLLILMKEKLNDQAYYSVGVPVYVNTVVKEKMFFALDDSKWPQDEKNGKKCEYNDIRVNKVWGNYMCVTDLEWYHIKENWVVRDGSVDVSNLTSTEYKVYSAELKFNIE